MATFNYPFHVTKDTPAIALEVQSNFDQLLAWVLTNLVQADGSIAMTGPLVLAPGAPAAPEQAANKAYVDASNPVGMMSLYAGTSLPAGWLWCDGTVYTNTSQPRLAAAIGRVFSEAAVPANSFAVPDMRKRAPVGADASEAAVFGLGVKGGQRNSELLQHSHSVPAHGHTAGSTVANTDHYHHQQGTFITSDAGSHGHGWSAEPFLYNSSTFSDFGLAGGGNIRTATWASSDNGLHNHSVTISGITQSVWNNNPGGISHGHTITVNDKAAFDTVVAGAGTTLIDKNLPPYVAVNYIIYAGA